MMPRKTAAERQKQYREKLKILNPEKYKELKQKTAARALEYYRKKQRTLTEEQKEELRLRRREKDQNAKNAQSETQDQDDSDHLIPKPFQRNCSNTRNSQRRNEQKGRKEIREVQDSISVRKDIMTTDGTYEPVLSTVDAKILSIMGDREPLSNSCDGAFKFYKNVEDVIICDVSKPTETVSCDVTNTSYDTSDDTSDDNDTSDNASYIYLGKVQKKIMVPKNKIMVKKTYYEKRMKSPSLEEKIKLSEYSLILKKHKLLDLEIKIKQKEYENMIK